MNRNVVVYFSYSGNTEKIVNKISSLLDVEVIKVEPFDAYPNDYDLVTSQGKEEVESNFIPKIKQQNIDLTKYDKIILGTPVWWYSISPVIKSFILNNNLDNKIVIPFMTNAGWLGHTLNDFKNLLKNSTIKNPMNIKFNNDKLLTSDEELDNWINSIGEL